MHINCAFDDVCDSIARYFRPDNSDSVLKVESLQNLKFMFRGLSMIPINRIAVAQYS
jgi:hypothetical protein